MTADYWKRIRDEADRLGTDGCTMAGPLFRDCCKRHDCEWRTGVTIDGDPITYEESNERFLACMQSRSIFGYYTPVGWVRYWLVRSRFGQKAWDDNAECRKREAARRQQRDRSGDSAA